MFPLFLALLFFLPSVASAQTVIPGMNRIEMLAATSGGKIIAAGIAGSGKNADFAVVRLRADLTIDQTFGRDGIARIDAGGREHLYGLAIRPDKKIIVAGFTQKRRQSDFVLARLTTRGERDASFGKNGLVTTDIGAKDEIHFVALTGNNSIVTAGFAEENGKSDFVVVRYRPDGRLDTTFGQEGIARIDLTRADRLYGVATGPDGKIVAAGSARNKESRQAASHQVATGEDECVALKLSPRGKPDKTFGRNGIAAIGTSLKRSICSSVMIQPDGKIVVAGYAERGDLSRHSPDFLIARLLPNGKMDRRFGPEGIQLIDFKNSIDSAHALAVDRSGRIITAGDGNTFSGSPNSFIALTRLLANGRLDRRFGNGGKTIIPFDPFDSLRSLRVNPERAPALRPASRRVDNGRRGEVTTMTVLRKGGILIGGSAGPEGFVSFHRSE